MAANDDVMTKCLPIAKMLFGAFMKSQQQAGTAAPAGQTASTAIKSFAGAFGQIAAGGDDKWKQTNIGGIGSDRDKALRKEAAASEAAFQGAGQQLGIEIWRVEQFKPVRLPKQDWGNFNDGDSYIVCNTYQLPNKSRFEYDLHYWLGKHSTQDEKGAAAYFTVNIDDLLGTLAVQHREVQGAESDLLKSYFGGRINYLAGGVPSGFQEGGVPFTATPGTTGSQSIPVPQAITSDNGKALLKVSDETGCVEVTQIQTGTTLSKSGLTAGDVFVAAAGGQAYVWFGKDCSPQERLFITDATHVVLREGGLPEDMPATFLNQGHETPAFNALFSDN